MERAAQGDEAFGRVLALVRFLRESCEWDARQTPESLIPYLLEEAHETAEAIGGDAERLAAELGDLLLNVAFQVVLAEERSDFGPEDVARAIERKMVARHPHVYGDAEEAPDWERLKAREREDGARGEATDDPLAGLPRGLKPLSRALRVQERAAGIGFDWPDVAGAVAKLREEIVELSDLVDDRTATPASTGRSPSPEVVEEAGDLLFAAVNVCRLAGVQPHVALGSATEKFERRLRAAADRALRRGVDTRSAGLSLLDELWEAVKADERADGDGH